MLQGTNRDLRLRISYRYLKNVFCLRPKKLLLFPEMWVTIKIFTRASANYFFFIHFPEISSFLLQSLLLFWFLFFCLFVLCFLKLKVYILIHIWLCGRVSDKKTFTRPISGNKTNFFGPYINHKTHNVTILWSINEGPSLFEVMFSLKVILNQKFFLKNT